MTQSFNYFPICVLNFSFFPRRFRCRHHQLVLAVWLADWISAGLRMAQRHRWRSMLFYRNHGLQLSRLSLLHHHYHAGVDLSGFLWSNLSRHSPAGEHVRHVGVGLKVVSWDCKVWRARKSCEVYNLEMIKVHVTSLKFYVYFPPSRSTRHHHRYASHHRVGTAPSAASVHSQQMRRKCFACWALQHRSGKLKPRRISQLSSRFSWSVGSHCTPSIASTLFAVSASSMSRWFTLASFCHISTQQSTRCSTLIISRTFAALYWDCSRAQANLMHSIVRHW